MILFIDNYDSFVHNLARYFECAGMETKTVRNDEITIRQIIDMNPDGIVLSPGPCSPNEAGISLEIVEKLGPKIPILGVCLGHQVIAQAYGGEVSQDEKPTHGKSSIIKNCGDGIFHGLPSFFNVGRYHSLITNTQKSKDLIIDAVNEENIIMAFHHKFHPVYGVQFHPESILTEYGIEIIQNFANIVEHHKQQTKQAA